MLLTLLCIPLSLAGILVGVSAWTAQRISDDVDRVQDAFPSGSRPAASGDALTFLLVGLDRAEGRPDGEPEMMMLLHLTGDRRAVQVISLPPRLWVAGDGGQGITLHDAFADGGARALVARVEQLTALRMDHYAEMDFGGFRSLADALGGLDVRVTEPYGSHGYDFTPGVHRLDGDRALAYLRSGDTGDDATAADRQRAVLTAVFRAVEEQGLFGNIGRVSGLIGLLSRSLRVDDTVDDAQMVELAWDLRGGRSPDVIETPIGGVGNESGHNVLYTDPDRAGALWGYLHDDSLGDHLGEFA